MVDTNEQKAFVAAVRLAQEVNQPGYRSFLQRNLKGFLDVHDRKLSNEKDTNVETTCREFSGLSLMQDKTMLEPALGGQRPVLSITSLKLRRAHDSQRSRAPPRATNEDGDPDWLPRDDESRVPCMVTVAVLEAEKKRSRHMEAQQAIILCRGRGSKNPTFDIRLQKPIQFEPARFLASAASRSGAKKHHIEVSIQCRESDGTADFLSQVVGANLKEGSSVTGSQAILLATWGDLSDLPRPGTLVPLQRGRGEKSVELPYGAEICMSWNERASPLVTCNRVCEQERRARLQLPTPASEEFPIQRTYSVTYLFRHVFHLRTIVTRDLKCILCEGRAAHSSFERLRLHYLTHHDHLEFEASEDPDDPDCKILRVSNPQDKPLVLDPTEPKTELNWEAPGEVFDITAHLEGDTMWTHSRTRGTTRTAAQKGKSKQPANSPAAAAPPLITRPKRDFVPPEEVQDLPQKKVRRHKVPKLPGISFYRTTSKQTLEQGVEISDSDEEPDDSWLWTSQHQHLKDLQIDDVAIDFHEVFNRHFSEERSTSDRLTRDAVVRFARKYRSKLGDPLWAKKFYSKLLQLESRRVIGQDVVDYCTKIITYSGENVWQDRSSITATPEPRGETNDLFPDSPPSAQTMRFRNAIAMTVKNSPAEKGKEKPFGCWKIVATRPQDAKLPVADIAIRELIDEELSAKPVDTLQPSDLDWEKFLNFLESEELAFNGNEDSIWCKTNKGARKVENHDELQDILGRATKGPIVVELLSQDAVDERVKEIADKELARAQAEQAAIEAQTEAKKSTKNMCVCGARIDTMRGTIACANARCYRAFHMKCVKLEKRSFDWKCPDCA